MLILISVSNEVNLRPMSLMSCCTDSIQKYTIASYWPALPHRRFYGRYNVFDDRVHDIDLGFMNFCHFRHLP